MLKFILQGWFDALDQMEPKFIEDLRESFWLVQNHPIVLRITLKQILFLSVRVPWLCLQDQKPSFTKILPQLL